MIVDAGLDLVAKIWSGFKRILWGALGDDDTAPVAGNTTLGNEIGLTADSKRKELTDPNVSLKFNQGLHRFTLSTSEPQPAGADTFKEIGLFDKQESGTMYNRSVFNAIDKTALISQRYEVLTEVAKDSSTDETVNAGLGLVADALEVDKGIQKPDRAVIGSSNIAWNADQVGLQSLKGHGHASVYPDGGDTGQSNIGGVVSYGGHGETIQEVGLKRGSTLYWRKVLPATINKFIYRRVEFQFKQKFKDGS